MYTSAALLLARSLAHYFSFDEPPLSGAAHRRTATVLGHYTGRPLYFSRNIQKGDRSLEGFTSAFLLLSLLLIGTHTGHRGSPLL